MVCFRFKTFLLLVRRDINPLLSMKKYSFLIFFHLIALTAPTFAAVQTSSNYTVLSDAVDGGGARCASANYSNDGSVSGFGGLVASSTPQEANRTGYAGQLYEVTAFTLSAPSNNLNEASSMSLYAVQFLDDGTVSSANSFAQWSFTSPIASVNAAGIVTAGNVSQNTPATINANLEGWSASLNLTVIFTGSLPGYNQITGQLLSGGKMQLSFVGSNGMYYALDRSFSLSPANWIPQATNPADANGNLVFTNTPVPSTNNFWRIRSVP